MILLDTHVWWWSLSEPERLSKAALKKIRESRPDQRAIASISIWEFAMMVFRKKIEIKISAGEWFSYAMEKSGIKVFGIDPKIAIDVCNLPEGFHKDPADRMIVSTARVNNLTLITKDEKILKYPYVKTLW